jgi:MPBQ/MSBQ methyltransferase
LLQHKTEAYWFYRVLSLVYDRWVNPLFWTPAMRTEALAGAALDDRSLRTLDVGAGTGFTTEGIVERVEPACVTMLDQSPHQLARARAKPSLGRCEKLLGDAEALPFPDGRFDRYVSAGSIEYWPDPERALSEAYRVLRPGGRALVVGPVRPAQPLARRLADAWMLFPTEEEYRRWMTAAGFADVELVRVAPSWYRGTRGPYAVAAAGTRPASGPPPAPPPSAPRETLAPLGPAARVRTALRFAAGSLAGALFIPLAAAMVIRERLQRWRTA